MIILLTDPAGFKKCVETSTMLFTTKGTHPIPERREVVDVTHMHFPTMNGTVMVPVVETPEQIQAIIRQEYQYL